MTYPNPRGGNMTPLLSSIDHFLACGNSITERENYCIIRGNILEDDKCMK